MKVAWKGCMKVVGMVDRMGLQKAGYLEVYSVDKMAAGTVVM